MWRRDRLPTVHSREGNDGVSFDLGHLFDWLDLIVGESVGRLDDHL